MSKPLLKNHGAPDDSFDAYCIRSNYLLMLVGAIASPLGERREITPDDLTPYGDWQAVESAKDLPTVEGDYMVAGVYSNDDVRDVDAVLWAWYHGGPNDADTWELWECNDGAFTLVRAWMEIPWLPDVWEAARQLFDAETVRIRADLEAMEAAQ